MRLRLILTTLTILTVMSDTYAADTAPERGTVSFRPPEAEQASEMYRLGAHNFDFELVRKSDLAASGVTVHRLTFPSPVTTKHEENNTVHAEYYVPQGKGPFPAVIVLEILGGGDGLARGMANVLAQNKVAALFVRM